MSCGTWEPSVCALLICLVRNEASVLEEEGKSVRGQSPREFCQAIRANNAWILSQVTQTGSCTSRGWERGKQSLWLTYLYWARPVFSLNDPVINMESSWTHFIYSFYYTNSLWFGTAWDSKLYLWVWEKEEECEGRLVRGFCMPQLG